MNSYTQEDLHIIRRRCGASSFFMLDRRTQRKKFEPVLASPYFIADEQDWKYFLKKACRDIPWTPASLPTSTEGR